MLGPLQYHISDSVLRTLNPLSHFCLLEFPELVRSIVNQRHTPARLERAVENLFCQFCSVSFLWFKSITRTNNLGFLGCSSILSVKLLEITKLRKPSRPTPKTPNYEVLQNSLLLPELHHAFFQNVRLKNHFFKPKK